MSEDKRPTQAEFDAATVLCDVVPPEMKPHLQDVINRAKQHGVRNENV